MPEPEIIPNDENDRMTPSVIMFDEDCETVGKIAKQNARATPETVVEFVKREMGRSKGDFSREFDGKEYSAEELSARILKKLKQDAEAHLKTEVTDAVITVPAYFQEAEREATRNAGTIAGLKVLQVLNEPTAAALAYGIDQLGSDQNVFVFDLGGGTLDVTVMNVSGAAIRMVATHGNHRLGGKDWDDQLILHVAETFQGRARGQPVGRSCHLPGYSTARHSRQGNVVQDEEDQRRLHVQRQEHHRSVDARNVRELTADLLDECESLCKKVLEEGENDLEGH